MNQFLQHARDAILPLSLSATLPEAFREWRFTGNYHDYGQPYATCELCGHEDLRYHFVIANDHTAATLSVGSQCVLRFNIGIYEGGQRLSGPEAKKKLDSLTQKMRRESCLAALSKLAETEQEPILQNALEYYRKNKKLTPKFAFVVFWRLQKNGIDHSPSFFSISLRRQSHILDLQKMPTDRVHFFWKALTPAQRQRATEMGHKPPPSAQV